MGEATADLDLQSDEFKEFSNSEDVKPLLSTVFSTSSDIKTELSFLTFRDIKPNMTFINSQDNKTVVTPDFSSSTDTKSECTFSSFADVKHHMTFLTSQDKTTGFLIFKDMEPAVSAVCTRSEDIKPELAILSTSEDIKPELENKSTSEDLKPELAILSFSEDIKPELETLSTNKDIKPDLWTKFLDSEDKQQNGLEEKLKLSEDKTYLSVDPHDHHEQFFQRSNLNKQAQVGERPLECDACHKRFSDSSRLSKHKKIHSGDKPYECDVCHKRFSRNSDLAEHKKVHSGEKPHECDVCHKKFSNSSALSSHKKIHLLVRQYECDVCHKRFSRNSYLATHKKAHSGDKPHECAVCHKKFSQSSSLYAHKRVHSGDKPFECDVCQKKFSRSSSLYAHKRVHSEDKPFECDVCHKKFLYSSNLYALKRPLVTHECDLCHKMFSGNSDLRKHKRVYSGDKQFECDVLQFYFFVTCSFIRSSMGEATGDLDLQSDEFKEFSNSEDDDKTVVTPDFSSSTDTKSECTTFSSFDDVKHHMTFLPSQDKTTGFLIFKDMEPAVSAVYSEDKQQNGLEEKLKLSEDETYLSVDPHDHHEQFFQRSNLSKKAQVGERPLECDACHKRFSDSSRYLEIKSKYQTEKAKCDHERVNRFLAKYRTTPHITTALCPITSHPLCPHPDKRTVRSGIVSD
ncbi:zinc finger protein 708-like [Physella acuta]|uniref:zinc finger protein 708-like n=1 Tax=Physella acuta TaxID=109671 RepID=UPI0027DBE02D|nr:zinc finger protein 708-like [Physella acuta]